MIMFRRTLTLSLGALFALALSAAAPMVTPADEAANPCAAKNPCAASNPCNPCAAKNPCAAGNPCNPCGGGASARMEGVMIVGQVVGYKGNYLNVRSSDGKMVSVHLQKLTITRVGNKVVGAKSLRPGMSVNISTQARGNYFKANFIYARSGGGGNPCNPCAANPCAASNPCAAKNPCAGRNPCNPCAGK